MKFDVSVDIRKPIIVQALLTNKDVYDQLIVDLHTYISKELIQ
ncbi:hypothetical protein [Mycoplasma sp. E35C]|nr:hypothetical protein [Mycoplasma sp. E35C]